MAQAPPLSIQVLAPVGSLTQTLMKQLAIRLSCQKTAAKSLVISRRGERSEGGEAEQTNRVATFTVTCMAGESASLLGFPA